MLKDSKVNGEYHLVNIISIAGHMASAQNSDYCGSKFALTGTFDAIRQGINFIEISFAHKLLEIGYDRPNVCMTNIYPYFIDTGMFQGFNPRVRL